MSIATPSSLAERMSDLGNVPASRVLMHPPPGTATIVDLIQSRNNKKPICELVDGTLVEKPMGWRESLLAGVLLFWLHRYLEENPIGVVTGPDGLTRLFGDTVRGPDVAFVSWDRLEGGRIPDVPIPDLVPNFVIEILSVSNTYAEMSRKRREYFHAGVQLIWMVDPSDRTISVYTSANHFEIRSEVSEVDGGSVLPGWTFVVGVLFSKLDEVRK